jgi:hypothetical protein
MYLIPLLDHALMLMLMMLEDAGDADRCTSAAAAAQDADP